LDAIKNYKICSRTVKARLERAICFYYSASTSSTSRKQTLYKQGTNDDDDDDDDDNDDTNNGFFTHARETSVVAAPDLAAPIIAIVTPQQI